MHVIYAVIILIGSGMHIQEKKQWIVYKGEYWKVKSFNSRLAKIITYNCIMYLVFKLLTHELEEVQP